AVYAADDGGRARPAAVPEVLPCARGSVLVDARAETFAELLLYLRWHRFVVAELDGVATAAAGERLQFVGVVADLGQRHLRLDQQLAAALRVGAVDARALAGQAAG